jgi:hypothetical protein
MPQILNIDDLKVGLPAITPVMGAMLAEALMICLYRNGFESGINIGVENEKEDLIDFEINWNDDVDIQIDNSWKDQVMATEFGAVGLSVLLVSQLTNYTVVQQSYRSTGFDYWLGIKNDENGSFMNTARLEISGIFNGGKSVVKQRVKLKIAQTDTSDYMNLPAYISVIEFSVPFAIFTKK